MRASLRLAVLLSIVLFSGSLFSQSQSEVDDMVATAVKHHGETEEMARDFTFLETVRTVNYIPGKPNDKPRVDKTETYENIFLGEMPYMRLIEKDGKPLSGKDAKKEQERYEKAVKIGKGWNRKQQASRHEKFVSLDISAETLPTEYTHTLLRHENIAGSDTWVIDCKPKQSTKKPVLFQLWIDPIKHYMVRQEFTITTETSQMLAGTHGLFEYKLQNGAILIEHSHLASTVKFRDQLIPTEVDERYKDFKRFHSEVHIMSVHEVP